MLTISCFAVGAIVGAAVGGAVVLATIAALAVYLVRRHRRTATPTLPAVLAAQQIEVKPEAAQPTETVATTAIPLTASS